MSNGPQEGLGHPPCDIRPWLPRHLGAHSEEIGTTQGTAMTTARDAGAADQRDARFDADPVAMVRVDGRS